MIKDSLGDRMKDNYENRAKTYLVRRMPVIIRLDGKAFHSFTKGFKRPYDVIFHNAMNATVKYLCENIQGCKIGYTQSDEITLLITDFDTLTTDAWFDYAVEKMCSIAASMATLAFNKAFTLEVDTWGRATFEWWDEGGTYNEVPEELLNQLQIYNKAIEKGAMFDCRCFNIPKEEVVNCFIWRQQDATRNAIQMLGQCNFSHNELQDKSCNEIQDMLVVQKDINFNDMATAFKRGVCCKRNEESKWFIDMEIPIFSKDRDYIEETFITKEE